MDAVQVDDGLDGIQRTGLPDFGLLRYRVCDGGNQAGRYLGGVHLLQIALDLTHRHATGIQGDDFVIKASPTGLVLGY